MQGALPRSRQFTASMRPPPEGGGDGLRGRVRVDGPRASMRPPPEGGGDPGCWSTAPHGYAGFNEAAPRRTRRCSWSTTSELAGDPLQ